jgi:hypothetical protein
MGWSTPSLVQSTKPLFREGSVIVAETPVRRAKPLGQLRVTLPLGEPHAVCDRVRMRERRSAFGTHGVLNRARGKDLPTALRIARYVSL